MSGMVRRDRVNSVRRPSQGDVARLAGVSAQTVSRVANEHPNVDPATRERVRAAMSELGYRPNTAARALVTGRFGMIGVVSFDIGDLGNARTFGAITAAAGEAGFSVNFMGVRARTEQAVSEAVDRLAVQSVDGIVLIESRILDTPALTLPSALPVVVADGDRAHGYPGVDIDQADGARQAVNHLLSLGHDTVWHLSGPCDSHAAHRREHAWRDTLRAAGAPVPEPVRGDWSPASGYERGKALAADPEVRAVFAANDQMALGLLRALHEAGRSVPGEVSVVGFDDIPEAAYLPVPLTTVRQDFAEIGRHCVELLVERMANPGGPARHLEVPAKLVTRSSTGRPAVKGH